MIDNLLGSTPVTVQIGALRDTIPQFTKDVVRVSELQPQVTIAGALSKIRANFFFGTYAGSERAQNYYLAQLAAGLAVETGFISMYAGDIATVPPGYLLCDGSAVSRTLYAGLYQKIGDKWGAGDGSTTFNVPNYNGRVPVGAGSVYGVASTGGASTVTLSTTQIPSHSHGISDPGHSHGVADPGHAHGVSDPGHSHVANGGGGALLYGNGGLGVIGGSDFQNAAIGISSSGTGIGIYGAGTGIGIYGSGTGVSVQANGGGAAHENMPPFAALLFVIKT